jgi:hypothetical protein
VQAELRSLTGQQHVPFVFLQGKHVPAAEVIAGMKAPGAFGQQLKSAGIACTGYFRS